MFILKLRFVDKHVIRTNNLGKRYQLGPKERYWTLRDAIARGPLIFRANRQYIWALREITFEVSRGEVVGIIGQNGSGKSTLLKILSRVTDPTEGSAEISGRISSLLEIGIGFHPELTGRENIYLNGSILGMKKNEIDDKFDEIIDFSEIDPFVDTPVKRYSNGMYLRLAFAVAAYLKTDILMIDEILAVGDMTFQKKCLNKMGNIAQEGKTILFVSHNLGAVGRLCHKSIWLDKGAIAGFGKTEEVIRLYQDKYLTGKTEWKPAHFHDSEFSFSKVTVIEQNQKPKNHFHGDEGIGVEIQYQVKKNLSSCQIGVRVYTGENIVVFTTSDADGSHASALAKTAGSYTAAFQIPGNFLAPGKYYLSIYAHSPHRYIYEAVEQAVVFQVDEFGSLQSLDGRLGIVSPMIPWTTLYQSP